MADVLRGGVSGDPPFSLPPSLPPEPPSETPVVAPRQAFAAALATAPNVDYPPRLVLLRQNTWRLVVLCRSVCQGLKKGYLGMVGVALLVVATYLATAEASRVSTVATTAMLLVGSVLLVLQVLAGDMTDISLLLSGRAYSRSPERTFFHRVVRLSMRSNSVWWLFWQLYPLFGDIDKVCDNYAATWKAHYPTCTHFNRHLVSGRIGSGANDTNASSDSSGDADALTCDCTAGSDYGKPSISESTAASAATETTPPASPLQSLVLYIDNAQPTEVPCHERMDDRGLMEHLAKFYYMQKMRCGLLEALSFKTLGMVEVVEIQGNIAVGRRTGILELGRYTSNRRTYYFHKASKAEGTPIIDALRAGNVLLPAGETPLLERLVERWGQGQRPGWRSSPLPGRKDTAASSASSPLDGRRALNFVSTTHTSFAGIAVVLPFLLSLAVIVVWPVVATQKYRADVQMSLQTAFTVGSYVVTAGALLIALIAFVASVSQSGMQAGTLLAAVE